MSFSRIAMALLICFPAFGGYVRRSTITFAGATGSTQSNISLASITTAMNDLKDVAHGGQIQDATCTHVISKIPCDYIITDDPGCGAGATAYKWGFETYDGTAGTLQVWVKIPSLTTSAQVVYVCFGNTAIHSYQGGAAGAEFGGNTVGVWHMSTTGGLDFSGNGNNGTNSGATTATGLIDGALSFGGTAGMSMGANKTVLQPATLTISILVKMNNATQPSTGGYNWVVTQDYTTPRGNPYSAYAIMADDGGCGCWSFWFDNGTAINRINASAATARDTSFHYIVGTDTSGTQNLYIDSASAGTNTVAGSPAYSATGVFEMGRNSDAGEQSNVTIDEVRVASVVRSANWITTEYNNILSPPAMSAPVSVGSVCTLGLLGVGC